ncbi:MAG: hypothetical protein LBB88_10640 [Planctomycetaceae bacterium]|nr:hypothetical protein [Planctomycetaceae bacterium]
MRLYCSIKRSPIETQGIASLLFDQNITDRDARHCVSTLGLVTHFTHLLSQIW